jgi:hypothetical protein
MNVADALLAGEAYDPLGMNSESEDDETDTDIPADPVEEPYWDISSIGTDDNANVEIATLEANAAEALLTHSVDAKETAALVVPARGFPRFLALRRCYRSFTSEALRGLFHPSFLADF